MLQRGRWRYPRAALPLVARRGLVWSLMHAWGNEAALLGAHAGEAAVGAHGRGRGAAAAVAACCGGGGGGGVFCARAAAAVRAPAAAQDAEDEQAAQAGGEADDEGEVVVDPGADFVAYVAVAAAL